RQSVLLHLLGQAEDGGRSARKRVGRHPPGGQGRAPRASAEGSAADQRRDHGGAGGGGAGGAGGRVLQIQPGGAIRADRGEQGSELRRRGTGGGTGKGGDGEELAERARWRGVELRSRVGEIAVESPDLPLPAC